MPTEPQDLVTEARDFVVTSGLYKSQNRARGFIEALCDEVESLRNQKWTASRVIEWIDDAKRAPANTAFTAGNERQIACRYERLAQELEDVNTCDKRDLCEDHHD